MFMHCNFLLGPQCFLWSFFSFQKTKINSTDFSERSSTFSLERFLDLDSCWPVCRKGQKYMVFCNWIKNGIRVFFLFWCQEFWSISLFSISWEKECNTFFNRRKKTIFDSDSGIISDPRGNIDWKLIIGSFLFGIGWGIGGLCPGPFLLLIPLNSLKVPVFWGVPFFVGMKISQFINPKK